MAMSVFRKTALRFRNAATPQVREIAIASPAVGAVLQSCRGLFGRLDRADPFQADLSRKVWELRAHILFTLLPFDSPEIGLHARFEEIAKAVKGIPGSVDVSDGLEQAVQLLLEQPDNPKHRWLMMSADTGIELSRCERTGILSMMAMGKAFGWPRTTDGVLMAPCAVQVIDSCQSLASAIFARVIIPGTCHYLSSRLFDQLFHEGRTGAVDVLVYPGERFVLRQRLVPPESSIFRGRLTASRIICNIEAPADTHEAGEQDPDVRMRDVLWQMTHDGGTSSAPGLVPARYVLCRDARGLFVPATAHLLVWRGDTPDEYGELASIPVDRLAEGDCLVMQSTDTGYLLDVESAEAGFGQKMEEACDWRPALERLLLTARPEEIAQEMLAEGAHGVALSQSLRNWADGAVYGPGNRAELRALLVVLTRHGKLSTTGSFDQCVADHWRGLQELRRIRHRAGYDVRRKIYRQLAKVLAQLDQLRGTRLVVLDNGVRLQLSQVAAVDDQTRWVSASRLMDLQAMKGGRWHE